MLLKDLILETLMFQIRVNMKDLLSESINDYFALVISRLKRGDDLSDEEMAEVASLIAGMKVLSVPQYRQAMTKDDIGINPSSAQDLYNLLNKIPRTGKLDRMTVQVFTALKQIAPTIFKKELEEISAMRGATKQERDQIIAKLVAVITKINQAFNKTKAASANAAGATADLQNIG